MVSDFMENGSGESLSWHSSDSDSVILDLQHAEKILFVRQCADQYECDLSSTVHSLVLSLRESDLTVDQNGHCNASCIRRSLVRFLRLCGYDAAVCTSKWRGSGKVPGGEHEYIDVVNYGPTGSERMIVDVDFRSHFEIARAIDSYDSTLESLPVIYTGYWSRLKQLLQVMADAARSSLMQNSMPVPPWRSLGYLQSKWQSEAKRSECTTCRRVIGCWSEQCSAQLTSLKSSVHREMEKERLIKSVANGTKRKIKGERRQRHKPLVGLNL